MAPLSNLSAKNGYICKWDSECHSAFEFSKERLIAAHVMQVTDWTRPFRRHTDAFQVPVGGTLTRIDADGEEGVVSFFSKRLSPAEENYTADNLELLGLLYFLQSFRCHLEESKNIGNPD